MSELFNSNVDDINIERSSSNAFGESYTPLSDTRCDTESLHASSMVGLGPNNVREVVRVNPLGEVFELRNTSPDVTQDMSSRIERARINRNHGDPTVPVSRRRKVSLRKESRLRVATVKRQTA